MRINIEHCVNKIVGSDDGHDSGGIFAVKEMIRHLKELRDRTADGDYMGLDDFFELYVFNGARVPYKRHEPNETLKHWDHRITEMLIRIFVRPMDDKEIDVRRNIHSALEKFHDRTYDDSLLDDIEVELRTKLNELNRYGLISNLCNWDATQCPGCSAKSDDIARITHERDQYDARRRELVTEYEAQRVELRDAKKRIKELTLAKPVKVKISGPHDRESHHVSDRFRRLHTLSQIKITER